MAWAFQNPLATLKAGALAGQVDVAQPHLGLHALQLASAPLDGRICAVERDADYITSDATWPAKLSDAYVRSDDLVATYHASDDWPFAPQVYWRADTPPFIEHVIGSLSLQVSVSTHLLDTHPRISAVTQLPADEVLQVLPSEDDEVRVTPLGAGKETVVHSEGGAGCLVWRLPGGEISYAEIVPASDFRVLTIRRDKNNKCHARWELIGEFLEKGVIRRTRLQAVFLPRERDVELATECCRNVLVRPLPLTT